MCSGIASVFLNCIAMDSRRRLKDRSAIYHVLMVARFEKPSTFVHDSNTFRTSRERSQSATYPRAESGSSPRNAYFKHGSSTFPRTCIRGPWVARAWAVSEISALSLAPSSVGVMSGSCVGTSVTKITWLVCPYLEAWHERNV
jgi:hypothetical protein